MRSRTRGAPCEISSGREANCIGPGKYQVGILNHDLSATVRYRICPISCGQGNNVNARRLEHVCRFRSHCRITAADTRAATSFPSSTTYRGACGVTEVPAVFEVVEWACGCGCRCAGCIEEYRQWCDTRETARDIRQRDGASRAGGRTC
jgi:hypothetical protein